MDKDVDNNVDRNADKSDGQQCDEFPPLETYAKSAAVRAWFSLAVIFAFIAAGVIVYGAATSDSVTTHISSAVASLDGIAPPAFGWPR